MCTGPSDCNELLKMFMHSKYLLPILVIDIPYLMSRYHECSVGREDRNKLINWSSSNRQEDVYMYGCMCESLFVNSLEGSAQSLQELLFCLKGTKGEF